MLAIRKADVEDRLKQRLPPRLRRPIEALDRRVARFMERYSVTVLRIALGVVFVWFGALKVIDRSPVKDLVGDTVYWVDRDWFVPVLGAWEIVVGLGLIFPVALRLTLLLFWVQMAGTFLSLVILPGRSFQDGNPLLPSTTGEFVLKNLVLIAAGLVVGSSVHRRQQPAPADAVTPTARDQPA